MLCRDAVSPAAGHPLAQARIRSVPIVRRARAEQEGAVIDDFRWAAMSEAMTGTPKRVASMSGKPKPSGM